MTLKTCQVMFSERAVLHASDVILDRGLHWNMASIAEGSLQEMVVQWTKMSPENASRAVITTKPIDVDGRQISWLQAVEISEIAARSDFPRG